MKFKQYKLMESTKTVLVTGLKDDGEINTKYGPRTRLVIENDAGISINTLINESKKDLHPNSNLYRILARAGVKSLDELVGKNIELLMTKDGFWRIAT